MGLEGNWVLTGEVLQAQKGGMGGSELSSCS